MPRKFQTGIPSRFTEGGSVLSVEQVRGGVPSNPAVGGKVTVTPGDIPAKFTQESEEVFFDTLFDDFRLSVQSVYNFYTPGEELDESDRDYDKLEELPRYVLIGWDRAPDLPRPRNEIKRPGNKFSDKVRTDVSVNGLQFSMSSVLDFSKVRHMAANGYINVGTVGTRIETAGAGEEGGRAIDEELYLLSEDYRGIPINHLTSNDRPVETGVVFDQLGTTASTSKPRLDRLASLRGQSPVPMGVRKANVNMSSGMALGVLEGVSTGDTREHLENVLELSAASTELGLISALGDLKDERRLDEPSVQTPEGLPSLEYIGYVIQKQRLDDSGVFQTVEEIEVPDRSEFIHVDTRVAYGRVYRYRVRCVLRWTHPDGRGLREKKTDHPPSRTAVRPIAPHVSHFLNSSWSGYGTVAVVDTQPPDPPEDLRLRVSSGPGVVDVAWRFPANPQGDISSFTLYRRSMRGSVFTSVWEELGSFPPANGRFVDSVPPSEDRRDRWVYAMTSTSLHGERSPLSVQLSCRINPYYRHEGEDEVRQVSQPGVPLDAHGALSVMPPRRDLGAVVAKRRVAVWPRPGLSKFVNLDVDLVLRLESLDTGETRDILLDLNHVGMDPTELSPPVPGRVPLDATIVHDERRETPDKSTAPVRQNASGLASPK